MTRIKLFICFALSMLLPLQSLAAGYQLACFMQQHMDTSNHSYTSQPIEASKSNHTPSCHEQMMHEMAMQSATSEIEQQSTAMQDTKPSVVTDKSPHHAAKATKCISACAQANMAALPNAVQSNSIELVFNDYPPLKMHYASVTLPSLQRPPISLS